MKKKIVLQERGLEKKNCIAIVLQEKGVVGLGLYCDRNLYCKLGCVVGWHCIARDRREGCWSCIAIQFIVLQEGGWFGWVVL